MILDIIIIIIFVLSAFIGYKKGLINTLMSVITIIVAILLAFILKNSVADNLYKNTSIGTTLEERISDMISEEIEKSGIEELKNNSIINMIIPEEDIGQDVTEILAPQITVFIIKGISFVGIFIIVYIICYMLTMILNIVFKLPILGSFNKIGGVITNLIKSLIKIWVILALIYFTSFIPITISLVDHINESVITKTLYDNNIIVNLLKPKV